MVAASVGIGYLKRKSSHELLSEYAQLRKRYWGQHLWARGYWVATSGNVTDEVWKKYIEEQKPPEPDDDSKRMAAAVPNVIANSDFIEAGLKPGARVVTRAFSGENLRIPRPEPDQLEEVHKMLSTC